MDTFFKDLGDSVLTLWKRENFSLEKFPEIASAALRKNPPAKRVELSELMRDFLLTDEQPGQTDSPFGEPEIVVYSHPRFYIQLLFWMDGTTAIHQHAFSGAFHVMHGSSIHAHYEFDNARPVTPHISIGDVRLTKIEILETGRTVPIISVPIGGKSPTIHSLFHLESPSVTVVVRTQHDPAAGPQFNYLPPHLAIDPTHTDLLTMRRTQLLDVLEQTEDPGYAELVVQILGDLDFERGFYILRHSMGHLQQLHEWEPALKLFEKKHGTLAAGIAATLREEVRRDTIKAMRGLIIEPEHRFFLALLMNAPTREDMLKLVAQRFAKQSPLDIVMRWMQELMEASDEGVMILDARFPESLGVERDDQPEMFLSVFQYFLKKEKKLPKALRDLDAKEIKTLHAAFARSTLGLLIA